MAQTNQSAAVSGLLRAWGRGDLQARDDLVPLIYRESGAAPPPIFGGNAAITRFSRRR